MSNESCIFKIKSVYSSLRKSEKKVGDYVLEHIEDIPNLTIVALSQKIEVSQPTIIRFVKALGFEGYREFKDAIILEKGKEKVEEINPLYGFTLNNNDKVKDIPKKSIYNTIGILENTLKAINPKDFEKAIEYIISSKTIDIYAVENSSCVASDLSNKLLYLGLNTRYYSDNYIQHVCAGNLNKDDLAIGISYSGTSRDTVEAMRLAKKRGAKSIVITNFEDSIITKYADVLICTSNTHCSIYGNAIFSRSSQIAIVDMLYMGVILSDYKLYSKKLDRNSEIIKNKALIE